MADHRLVPPGIRDQSTLALADLIDRATTLGLPPLLIYWIDLVAESALPHLLEQFHVAGDEGAALAENATNHRSLIKRAIALHRYKGTPYGLKAAIRNSGFGEAEIIEGDVDGIRYDGDAAHDGEIDHGGGGTYRWAVYSVYLLDRPVTEEQAEKLRALCTEFAPRRCHLARIIYGSVPLRYNGVGFHDGAYIHGDHE